MTSQLAIFHPPCGGIRKVVERVVPQAGSFERIWTSDAEVSLGSLHHAEAATESMSAAQHLHILAILPDPSLRGLLAKRGKVTSAWNELEPMKALEILVREPVAHSRYAPSIAHLAQTGRPLTVAVLAGTKPDRNALSSAVDRALSGGSPSLLDISSDPVRGWDEVTGPILSEAGPAAANTAARCLDRYRSITVRYRDEMISSTPGMYPWA